LTVEGWESFIVAGSRLLLALLANIVLDGFVSGQHQKTLCDVRHFDAW
jgi:hypothetical protein